MATYFFVWSAGGTLAVSAVSLGASVGVLPVLPVLPVSRVLPVLRVLPAFAVFAVFAACPVFVSGPDSLLPCAAT
jgi:hypothetical protein